MIAYTKKYPKSAPIWISRSDAKIKSKDLLYPHWVAVPYAEDDRWMVKCQEKFNDLYWSTIENDYGISDFNSYLNKSVLLHTWIKNMKI